MAGFSYAGHEKNKCQTCQNSQSPINLPRAGAVAGARGGARRGDDGYIGVSLLRPGGAIAARAWRFNQCLCQNLFPLFFCLDKGRALIKKTCKTPKKTGDFASWAMVFFCHEGMNQGKSEEIRPGEWRIIEAMPQFLWNAFKMRGLPVNRGARFVASRTAAVRRWPSTAATLGTLCLFSSVGVNGEDVSEGTGRGGGALNIPFAVPAGPWRFMQHNKKGLNTIQALR